MWVRFTGNEFTGTTKVVGFPGTDRDVMVACQNLTARGYEVVSLTATPPADVIPALVASGRMTQAQADALARG